MRLILIVLLFASAPVWCESVEPPFQSAGEGVFTFDTGVVKGRLQAGPHSQSIVSMIDVKSGQELAHEGVGIFSYYRVFSTNKRYGDAARDWPNTSRLLSNGAVEIVWPPAADHPVELRATFKWIAPDTLDLVTFVEPQIAMPDFEVFLSSYFNQNMDSYVYAKSGYHTQGAPTFLAADVNPLVRGTYLAFPRDLDAAKILYDGRWNYPPHPVQFSLTQRFECPLCMRKDRDTGMTVLLMSRPEDCFAIETPYNMRPPDGVASHASLYFSLFGRDIQAGEKVKASTRLIIGKDIPEKRALEVFEKYISDTK